MSEGHANFFVSAVPGNEPSITTGSNGGQWGEQQPSEEPCETNFTHEAQHEWGESISIGENDNEQRRGQPTPDNDISGEEDCDNKHTLDEEPTNLMDNDIKSFRRKGVTKLKALSNIITILDFDTLRTEKTKDTAVKYYSHMINKIEVLAASVIKQEEQA